MASSEFRDNGGPKDLAGGTLREPSTGRAVQPRYIPLAALCLLMAAPNALAGTKTCRDPLTHQIKLTTSCRILLLKLAKKTHAWKKTETPASVAGWDGHYQLLGLLNLYEATGNRRFLRYYVKEAQALLANRDDKKFPKGYSYGKQKVDKGYPIWSDDHYTTGKVRYAPIVLSGNLSYALIRFADVVKKYGLTRYQAEGDRIIAAVRETVAHHDRQWNRRRGVYEAERYTRAFYRDSRGKPMAGLNGLPFNTYLSMGRAIAVLYRLTGEQRYYQRTKALATYFSRHLHKRSRPPKYVWSYRLRDKGQFEDISHAGADVQFVLEAFEAGVAGNDEHLKRFARTFVNGVAKGNAQTGYTYAYRVNGARSCGIDTACVSTGSWLGLSWVDPTVKRIVLHRNQQNKSLKTLYADWNRVNSALEFYHLSMLAKHAGRKGRGAHCRRDSECMSSLCNGTSRCDVLREKRRTCKANRECRSGVCFQNKVCAGVLGKGSTCSAHHECLSGNCTTNQCRGKTSAPKARRQRPRRPHRK